jgi:hypothetical protein
LTQSYSKYLSFNAKTNEGEIGLYFENNKKNARWRHKSEIKKRNLKTNISPLLLLLWGCLGCQKKQYDPLKFTL